MKVFRLENKYNLGPFIGAAIDGDEFLKRKDVDYSFPVRDCPPSNHHVYGFEYLSVLSSAFKNNFEILDQKGYQIAEYEISNYSKLDDNIYCFNITEAEFIRRIDVYGHAVDHVNNLDEFKKYSDGFAHNAVMGFPECLCDGYILYNEDGSHRVISLSK